MSMKRVARLGEAEISVLTDSRVKSLEFQSRGSFKSGQTNVDLPILIPLSAALLLGKSKGLVQQWLLDLRGERLAVADGTTRQRTCSSC